MPGTEGRVLFCFFSLADLLRATRFALAAHASMAGVVLADVSAGRWRSAVHPSVQIEVTRQLPKV
jgi:hypothetical protein